MLTIELVPRGTWFTNLRSLMPKEKWDELRKATYKKAGYQCEVCGGKGKKWPVECHEIWEYDDDNCVQTLKGLIALCPDCHQVKHVGLAQVKGKLNEARNHLTKVNKWSKGEADKYIREQFELWSERSEKEWTVDCSWIDDK